ncbi:MAG TPA: cyclopropane-fatty-acyl-phospholipid synthase family protein [Acidimicrobiales bacterium]|nr:cyclopropane-fatty-acyl-phospholipid synthase family protein [Acidimicrobiales bacterium]
MALAPLVDDILGGDIPVAVEAYDGSRAGPADASTRLVIRNADGLRRVVTSPGELGLARAYVAGDIDLEGSIWGLIALRDRMPEVHLGTRVILRIVDELGGWRQVHRVEPPPEEARLRGRRHSKARDAAAISHHYDVSDAFYRMVLGPSMTYSCAVFHDPADSLEEAQANKYELICRKLGLAPGMRLLDVGCGWGGMVMHAAEHHGVQAVGVTISRAQAQLAQKRVADAGLSDQVEIRVQDYRDVSDGPYDAISSIGMFEHVGEAHLAEYFACLRSLASSEGRLLNHGIAHPSGQRARLPRRSFVNRYVFPDGELHDLGRVVSLMQTSGFEVRHLETLREHYFHTLRRWVANLEAHWDEAVEEVGGARARIWRLYMAGAAINFEAGRTQVHQVLATPTTPDGRSGMPLPPVFG